MKNKKIIIFSSMAIFAFAVWLLVPFGESVSFAEVTVFPPEKLSEYAEIIIIGQHVNTSNQETFLRDDPLRAVSTFQVDEVLKGTYDSTTIEVFDFGEGAYYSNGYRMEQVLMIETMDYAPNEKVILFLEYDVGNVLGDGYYALGKYAIADNGNVEHYVDQNRNTSIAELRQIVNTHS